MRRVAGQSGGLSGPAVLLGVCLSGCTMDPRTPDEVEPVPLVETPEDRTATDERPSGPSPEVVRTMIIADILYEARKALEDNRLMVGRDNAYDLFNEVLDIAPDNEVAQAGLGEIVERYIALARNAIPVGQYDQAATYLDRAAMIEPQHAALQQTRQSLQAARDRQGEFFPLDEQQLRDRSLALMAELGEIGRYLKENELRFVITARTDEEARWIYQVMREAVGGYRLRGNIALGGQPGIRVQQPATDGCRPDAAC